MDMGVAEFIDLLLLLLLIICALGVGFLRDLAAAVIVFSIYSFILCLLWAIRGAPDVAMTEAAVGAGITAVLFLTAIAVVGRREKK
jgi:energy-converting hydrogenase B subunit D